MTERRVGHFVVPNLCRVVSENYAFNVLRRLELLDQHQDTETSLITFYTAAILSQNPVATEPHGLSGFLSFHSASSNHALTLSAGPRGSCVCTDLTVGDGKRKSPLAETGALWS